MGTTINTAEDPVAEEQSMLDKKNSKLRTYAAIFSLSCGSFAFGLNEFLILGLMPEIETTYSVDVSTAAWGTTAFMIGLAISSPIITAITSNIPRKYLVAGLLLPLIIAGSATALSPSFPIFLAARVLASFGHASYMGAGSYVATKLVPQAQATFASALFFIGLTLSLTVGVPIGTLFAQHTDWRSSYWLVAGFSVVSLLGILALVPKNIEIPKTNIKQELQIFHNPKVWWALSAAAFGYSGMLASHTYFTNMMLDLAGYENSDINWLTVLYGVGTAIGNIVGGKLADCHLLKTIYGLLLSLAAVLTGFYWAADYKIPATIALFLNGFVGFALVSPLMQYVTKQAGSLGAVMASASSISAFGVGIGAGVYLGGLTIDRGFGYSSPNWVGAGLTMFGFVSILINELLVNNKASSQENEPLIKQNLQADNSESERLSTLSLPGALFHRNSIPASTEKNSYVPSSVLCQA